jgi:uncharacterized heparinase superfamily protein
MIGRAARLWRTLLYLKPSQIYGRIWFRIYSPSLSLKPAPAQRALSGEWVEPARRKASMHGADSFRFLNEDGTLTDGWEDPTRTKLWQYNLHYFDDLNAENADNRAAWHSALIERWISNNQPGKGVGWEPYPTSLRIVNWIKSSLSGSSLSPAADHSLAVQVHWLAQRLEWHILGNHLLANAKALIFAGLYFEGQDAARWLAKGLKILSVQFKEQILPDGGHFELSPMYHALAVEDVLDLINIAQSYANMVPALNEICIDHLPSMLRWLHAMCHPDREISFFNDAAIGIAPSPEEIDAYAFRLGFAVDALPSRSLLLNSSGYGRLVADDAILLADVADIGPDYIPGHGHADTLSFEFSLHGHRLIVNSGTSVYGTGEERARQRSTFAHSTAIVDGQNSSEVWSGFRVGRRARATIEYFSENCLVATHDGYAHLKGSPIHRREWRIEDGLLTVVDEISGSSQHDVKLNFPFSPNFRLHYSDNPVVLLIEDIKKQDNYILSLSRGVSIDIVNTSWHPEFGLTLPSMGVQLSWNGQLPFRNEMRLSWSKS